MASECSEVSFCHSRCVFSSKIWMDYEYFLISYFTCKISQRYGFFKIVSFNCYHFWKFHEDTSWHFALDLQLKLEKTLKKVFKRFRDIVYHINQEPQIKLLNCLQFLIIINTCVLIKERDVIFIISNYSIALKPFHDTKWYY